MKAGKLVTVEGKTKRLLYLLNPESSKSMYDFMDDNEPISRELYREFIRNDVLFYIFYNLVDKLDAYQLKTLHNETNPQMDLIERIRVASKVLYGGLIK